MKKLSPALVVLGLLAVVQSAVAGDPGTTRGIIDLGKLERPADAVTLVGPDGYDLIPEGEAPTKWVFTGGILTASPAWDSVLTRESYRDFRMHVEFNVNEANDAKDPEANGNSGIYIQNRYEIQIHNSFGVSEADYKASYCGSIYRTQTNLRPPPRRTNRTWTVPVSKPKPKTLSACASNRDDETTSRINV